MLAYLFVKHQLKFDLMEKVILVDEQDKAIGAMDKMEAHRRGVLHRAFSILIFNSEGETLLQKRSKNKYHSGGLWTNACCSHPTPDEPIDEVNAWVFFIFKIFQNCSIEDKKS